MSDEDNGFAVPDKITIRLDRETRRAIENVMRSSSLKASAAVRLLLVLGTAREEKLDLAFKAAAWREAVFNVSRLMQKGVQELVNRTFDLVDDQK